MVESSAMTMDDAVEEIMRLHRSLPARPDVEEVAVARGVTQIVEKEVQLKLGDLEKQRKGVDVPDELFFILQEMRRNMIHFHSKEQKREAQKLLDLEGLHSAINVLIQRASEFVQSHSGSLDSGSMHSRASSMAISVSSTTTNVNSTVTTVAESPSFWNEDRVKKAGVSLSMDDMYLKNTKRSFPVADFNANFQQERIPTLEQTATSGEDGERLCLIGLARCIELSAKKGTRELILQRRLSDQIDWLPDSVGKLSSLINLDLSENRIITLPNAIGGLFSLQTLDLHGNRIRELPESIASLLSLLRLNLRGNQLVSFPPTIGKLVRLRELDLSSNALTGLPETIGSLTSLQILSVETNDLDEIPYTIGSCTSIKELHADYNHIKALPEAVGRLESLEILTVRYNNIRQLPTTVASLLSLRQLDLSFNELESIPESLCFAPKLVKLDVSNNFADLRALPRSIGNLETLEELMCQNNQIRNLPNSFGLLSRLRALNIEGNPLVSPPREVVDGGAQAVVEYIHDRVAMNDAGGKPVKKNKKPWARIWFFSHPNKRKRDHA